MNNLVFHPIQTKRIFEEISEQIKALIIDGSIKPGDKLPSERELAKHFNSGRMVVREALRVLEHAGFVYIKQGSEGGAFVKHLDTSVATKSISDLIKLKNVTLKNLTEARLSIEKEVVENVIDRITKADLKLLEKNIQATEKKVEKGIRSSKENLDFHLILARATKNPIFELMIQSVLDVTHYYILELQPDMKYVTGVLKYHQEIHEALKLKNKNVAKEKMIKHIMDVNDFLTISSRSKRTE